jgi:hypothetical protein
LSTRVDIKDESDDEGVTEDAYEKVVMEQKLMKKSLKEY